MGWFEKETKAFGREFARQGSILLFGKAPKRRKHRNHNHRRKTGAQVQYEKAQRWAKQHGFK
jgi:hypothetical protein